MNVIARLGFELVCYDITFQHFCYNVTDTHLRDLETKYTIEIYLRFQYGTIYQPLRSGRKWHKVNF